MMCASYVYKRRKLRNSDDILPKKKAIEISKIDDSCSSDFHCDYEHHLLSAKKMDVDSPGRTPDTSIDGLGYQKILSFNGNTRVSPDPHDPNNLLDSRVDDIMALTSPMAPNDINGFPAPDEKVLMQGSVNDPHRTTSDHVVNESCSSSKSNLEHLHALPKNGEEDACECSWSGRKGIEQQANFSSSREFCINVLKSSGMIGGVWHGNADVSLDLLRADTAETHQPCKVCGILENPRKMLVCDLCEETFHLACCQVKKPSSEDWYCESCFRKKPKPLLDAASGKIFPNISEEYKRRILQQELGPIHFMLIDTQPHTSGVRIGKDFQAEVPEWSGPVSCDNDCLGEPSKLDLNECCSVNGWRSIRSSRPISIGNWIQCRGVIYNHSNDKDEGVVCGKWRRAPLFTTQTDDWDCSCSVVWDPYHADCAVPQVLETEEVLKHLKCIELLTRLDKEKKSG